MDLTQVPRTICADPQHLHQAKSYGQNARLTDADGVSELSIPHRRGGCVDFPPFPYTDTGSSKSSKLSRVSDDDPMWAEFQLWKA